MAAAKGRELLVKNGSTVLAGVRTKGAAINNEPIDITSDDDLGYRTMLSDAGTMSVDLSVEGVTKDAIFRTLAATGGTGLMLTGITLEYPDGGILAGDFFLNSFEETGAYNEAMTFSASLQSSGAFTYTP